MTKHQSQLAALQGIEKLLSIVAILRAPGGCPWDREQTHASVKSDLLEETYEVIEAIDSQDDSALKEELGDLLLQVVFHSQIATETARFDFNAVVDEISNKLIRRHPHVFEDIELDDTEGVLKQWEAIKQQEQANSLKKEKRESVLDGVPQSLPALQYAQKILKKAAKVGFAWRNVEEAQKKLYEELGELKAVQPGNKEAYEDEMGDVLFTFVNVLKFEKLDAEDVMRKAVRKFEKRFRLLETHIKEKGKTWDEYSLEELNQLFRQVRESHE
ncbi:MAG: nucleoside triphosphate pyrophosphohydrolase [Verrucomicrobiota bacterium]|nr:nucleoside triphosphate pyrophosphohydrolase [Verrucomicrobiota bacterium]